MITLVDITEHPNRRAAILAMITRPPSVSNTGVSECSKRSPIDSREIEPLDCFSTGGGGVLPTSQSDPAHTSRIKATTRKSTPRTRSPIAVARANEKADHGKERALMKARLASDFMQRQRQCAGRLGEVVTPTGIEPVFQP